MINDIVKTEEAVTVTLVKGKPQPQNETNPLQYLNGLPLFDEQDKKMLLKLKGEVNVDE